MTTKHNLQHERAMMEKILAQVVTMENAGYQFEAAEASFDLLVRRCAGTFRPHFERLNFHVTVEAEGDGRGHDRGHGQNSRRRHGAPRGGRGGRTGQRPGRRTAQGACRPTIPVSPKCTLSITKCG